MQVIESHVLTTDAVFKASEKRLRSLVQQLQERTAHNRLGGGSKYLDRHRAQQIALDNRLPCVYLVDSGGADVRTRLSGVADYLADDDAHAIGICRTIVSTLPTSKRTPSGLIAVEAPRYDPSEIYGIVNADIRQPYDVREIIARIVDGSRFDEFRERYGTMLVTGFAYIHGIPVGIVANHGVLFSESALKATHFIELCNLRSVPLIFLQNITGFIVGRQYERAVAAIKRLIADVELPSWRSARAMACRTRRWPWRRPTRRPSSTCSAPPVCLSSRCPHS